LKAGFANCFNEINQLIENPEIEINGVEYELIFLNAATIRQAIQY